MECQAVAYSLCFEFDFMHYSRFWGPMDKTVGKYDHLTSCDYYPWEQLWCRFS